jgi:hypothetical protein
MLEDAGAGHAPLGTPNKKRKAGDGPETPKKRLVTAGIARMLAAPAPRGSQSPESPSYSELSDQPDSPTEQASSGASSASWTPTPRARGVTTARRGESAKREPSPSPSPSVGDASTLYDPPAADNVFERLESTPACYGAPPQRLVVVFSYGADGAVVGARVERAALPSPRSLGRVGYHLGRIPSPPPPPARPTTPVYGSSSGLFALHGATTSPTVGPRARLGSAPAEVRRARRAGWRRGAPAPPNSPEPFCEGPAAGELMLPGEREQAAAAIEEAARVPAEEEVQFVPIGADEDVSLPGADEEFDMAAAWGEEEEPAPETGSFMEQVQSIVSGAAGMFVFPAEEGDFDVEAAWAAMWN